MNKTETTKLLNKIKGYYNSQFFIDEYVIEAWYDTMEPYALEDALEHIKEFIKENPDLAPKPQTFKRNLLTIKEKEALRNAAYTVECNLCHRWMPMGEYDAHYGKCLDIDYLLRVAKTKGLELTREQLEDTRKDVIEKLMVKYPPEEVKNGYTDILG